MIALFSLCYCSDISQNAARGCRLGVVESCMKLCHCVFFYVNQNQAHYNGFSMCMPIIELECEEFSSTMVVK